jgi:predicted nucleic acid-binding protein
VELADTSAWSSRFGAAEVLADFTARVTQGRIATCAPVMFELLWSEREAPTLASRRESLEQLPRVAVGERVWRRALDVMELLGERGPLHHREVPLPDLLVAAAAETAGIPVLHYDRHFELVASVTGQPVRAIAPLGSL